MGFGESLKRGDGVRGRQIRRQFVLEAGDGPEAFGRDRFEEPKELAKGDGFAEGIR